MMFRKPDPAPPEQPRLPEFRVSRDPIADAGRSLRERLDALCHKTDVKHWR